MKTKLLSLLLLLLSTVGSAQCPPGGDIDALVWEVHYGASNNVHLAKVGGYATASQNTNWNVGLLIDDFQGNWQVAAVDAVPITAGQQNPFFIHDQCNITMGSARQTHKIRAAFEGPNCASDTLKNISFPVEDFVHGWKHKQNGNYYEVLVQTRCHSATLRDMRAKITIWTGANWQNRTTLFEHTWYDFLTLRMNKADIVYWTNIFNDTPVHVRNVLIDDTAGEVVETHDFTLIGQGPPPVDDPDGI